MKEVSWYNVSQKAKKVQVEFEPKSASSHIYHPSQQKQI